VGTAGATSCFFADRGRRALRTEVLPTLGRPTSATVLSLPMAKEERAERRACRAGPAAEEDGSEAKR
jgi:hypothetical protein